MNCDPFPTPEFLPRYPPASTTVSLNQNAICDFKFTCIGHPNFSILYDCRERRPFLRILHQVSLRASMIWADEGEDCKPSPVWQMNFGSSERKGSRIRRLGHVFEPLNIGFDKVLSNLGFVERD